MKDATFQLAKEILTPKLIAVVLAVLSILALVFFGAHLPVAVIEAALKAVTALGSGF